MGFKITLGLLLTIFLLIIVQLEGYLQSSRQIKSLGVPYHHHFDLVKMPSRTATATSAAISRREKRQRLSPHASNDSAEVGNEGNFYPDQFALIKIYRGVSMLYVGQILMSFKKSGFTLACFNVIGGPLVAAGLMLLLGNAAKNQNLEYDTFKRLNGLMVLYSTLALMLVALVPQLHSPFGLLWLVTATSSLWVTVKGYFAGLKADKNKIFFPETQRLLNDAAKVSIAIPPKGISYIDFFLLWTVAIKKTTLVLGILQILLSTVGPMKFKIIPRLLSHLMKLTILGGSLVTETSIEDDSSIRHSVAGPVNMLVSYVFFSMGGAYV